MRPFVMLCFFLGFVSCNPNDFDQGEADKLVVLTQTDFELYDDFKDEILSDLVQIRKVAKSLSYGSDTTFLSTNSYYLYQIDKGRYEPIISELKKRHIYVDDINTSYYGTIEFRIKETADQRSLPHFSYTHLLVFKGFKYKPPYSQTEMLKDSTWDREWKYIYIKSQVGH